MSPMESNKSAYKSAPGVPFSKGLDTRRGKGDASFESIVRMKPLDMLAKHGLGAPVQVEQPKSSEGPPLVVLDL